MRILCLTHEQEGHSGLFGDVVRERDDELLEWNVSQGPPPESPADFDALVVFGGSMHVDQERRHPWLTGQHVPTEWAWGFFTGGAAVLGSWLATHSQRHIPEKFLRGVLGVSNGVVGLLYVCGYLGITRFKI